MNFSRGRQLFGYKVRLQRCYIQVEQIIHEKILIVSYLQLTEFDKGLGFYQ